MRDEQYLLGHSDHEEQRLRRQAQELAHETRWLIEEIGVAPGARALDLGCGPEGALLLLAERIGPSGAVVGLDVSARSVALARELVRGRGLAGVEVIEGDARATALPRASFDLVHARFVLINVPRPEEIVKEMITLTRPGGVVACHEGDYGTYRCDPPHPSWDRLLDVFESFSRDRGIDPFIGRRVYSTLCAAGLVDVRVRPLIHAYPHGHPRRPILIEFIDNIRAGLLESGRISEDELDAHVQALREHLARPDVMVISHLFFQVWGRRPGATAP